MPLHYPGSSDGYPDDDYLPGFNDDNNGFYSYGYYGRPWKGQLPADLLPNILQYADCRHRLNSCALVGRAWKKAATAASADICCTLPYNDKHTNSLAEWLQEHGGSTVQSIALTFQKRMHDYSGSTTIKLPLQQLKQLRSLDVVNRKSYHRTQVTVMLQCGAVINSPSYGGTPAGSSSSGYSPAGSSSSGYSPAASSNSGSPPAPRSYSAAIVPLEGVSSSLTSLKLHSIKLQPSWENSYGCITALTALQLLDLKQSSDEGPDTTVALTGALPLLTTLTKLQLEWQISKALKAAVGQLTKLQELRLCHQKQKYGDPHHQAGNDGQQLNLPNSLTYLEVDLAHSFCRTYTPSLSGITALQHLQLKHVTELDPTMMKHMTRLTHLELCVNKTTSNGVAELLAGLASMQRLHHLQLVFGSTGVGEEHNAPVADRQQCGAFTSSSHLTSLQLSGMQLPSACGQELFPSTRKLPLLTTLKINGTGWKVYRYYPDSSSHGRQPIGGPADIYSLIECCPNLVELDLAGAVQPGTSLSCLSHLEHLAELTVGGPTMDNICAAAVAAVTGLMKLTVMNPAPYKYTSKDTAMQLRQSGYCPDSPPLGRHRRQWYAWNGAEQYCCRGAGGQL
jgi:hypothetical protein